VWWRLTAALTWGRRGSGSAQESVHRGTTVPAQAALSSPSGRTSPFLSSLLAGTT